MAHIHEKIDFTVAVSLLAGGGLPKPQIGRKN
jgi:hypothetical protein